MGVRVRRAGVPDRLDARQTQHGLRQINSELARHDYETYLEADAPIKQIHALTSDVHACICTDER